MPTLQDLHEPIDRELAQALIAATPDTWNSAEMIVERLKEGDTESLMISITSPEGHKDIVLPTDEIYDGLHRLSDVFESNAKRNWQKVKYSISLSASGSWDYAVAFEY